MHDSGPGSIVLDAVKTDMKKGKSKSMTRKIVASQAEFDAAVADPPGVAVVQFVGDSIDLVVEKNVPFVRDCLGKSNLLTKPEAGKVAVRAEDAARVVCDNPEADLEGVESAAFHGVCTAAESVSVSVAKAKTVTACHGSDTNVNGPVGTVFAKDRVVVRAGEQARGVNRARGVSHVCVGDGSDVTAYACDGSTIDARCGRVLATDGSVVSAVGDGRIQASGRAAVVSDSEKSDVVAVGQAVLVPRLWDKRDIEAWAKFTGARVDGNDCVSYTWLDGKFRLEENPACPLYKRHRASMADAATFLSESDRLFEVRVSESDVKELWYDKPYAAKFTPVREINLASPMEEK